jgi:hypothetical protein
MSCILVLCLHFLFYLVFLIFIIFIVSIFLSQYVTKCYFKKSMCFLLIILERLLESEKILMKIISKVFLLCLIHIKFKLFYYHFLKYIYNTIIRKI